MEVYIHGVVQEAKDRNTGYIRDIDSFIELRRRTVGATVTAVLHFLFTEIPNEVLDHPTMQRLVELIVDIMMYDNVRRSLSFKLKSLTHISQDIVSYQKENAADEPHNMLTVYMHARKAPLQEAIDRSGKEIDRCVEEFVQL